MAEWKCCATISTGQSWLKMIQKVFDIINLVRGSWEAYFPSSPPDRHSEATQS